MRSRPRSRAASAAALALALVAAALLSPTVAVAGGLAQEESEGHAVVANARAAETRCSDLTAGQYELVGEYVMGRRFADAAAHQAMNDRMTAFMGPATERRMHVALGRRYLGCPGSVPNGFGKAMNAMMNGDGRDVGPWMMGGYGAPGHHGTSGMSDAVLFAILAVVVGAIGAGAVLLAANRRKRDERHTSDGQAGAP
jgi:hypothetical protein